VKTDEAEVPLRENGNPAKRVKLFVRRFQMVAVGDRRRGHTAIAWAVALVGVLVLLVDNAIDGDPGLSDVRSGEGSPRAVPRGGEIVDVGTFATGPPETIDPALNTTVNAYQVINQVYDSLTDIDYSDPAHPQVVGAVAASWTVNDQTTEYVFTIRDDLHFSDGEQVLPSSFARGWERASDPDFAGYYSYLFELVDGGAEKLAGTAGTISGVAADDQAMTLTVTMDAPYADWPFVAAFQTLSPMPSAVEDLDDQGEWQNGLMIGNGPFKLARPRSDSQITLVRNPEWDGTRYEEALGLPEQPYLEQVTFRPVDTLETGFLSFEAGEAQIAPIPAGQFAYAAETYGTTDVNLLATYYYLLRWDDPVLGGPENRLLRQAISQAINREDITETVWDGVFPVATGLTPPGVPGYQEGLCDHCDYDPEAAAAALQEWQDAGNELPEGPIEIQYNVGGFHQDVTTIIVDNLAAIGIEAVAEPMDSEAYFSDLSEGACTFCRAGWFGDYPTYDNFLYDPFSTDSIGGNNHGFYSSETFDQLVAEAKATPDEEEQADLYRQAERHLLNEDVAVVPLAWYRGDYVFDEREVVNFTQTPLGLIRYEILGAGGR
jgi:oligopeptide transport system substrate-binding protein